MEPKKAKAFFMLALTKEKRAVLNGTRSNRKLKEKDYQEIIVN